MLFSVILFMLGIIAFMNPTMTGFFSYEATSGTIVAQDGATEDGLLWTNIDGAGVYKRCMQLTATSSFDAVQLLAKVTSAIHTNELTFSLYTNNGVNNEPAKQIGSCKVKKYDAVWKSCSITNLQQQENQYWMCVGSTGKKGEQTHYLLNYKLGGNRKTALWIGDNWQKLEGVVYTIKAQFMQK